MIEIRSAMILSLYKKNKHDFLLDSTNISNFTLTINQGEHRKIPLLLILRDPKGHVRIQYQTPIIGEKLVIAKEEKYCSAGCVGGEITEGYWELEVIYTPHSADKVQKFTGEKVDYKVTITFNEEINREYNRENFCKKNVFIDKHHFEKVIKEQHRWYKGDFHVHTDLTDGEMNDELAMSVCEKQNLDFLYATEHNIIIPSYQKGNTLIIPSMELTTPYGHYNIFGMKEYINFTNYFDHYMNEQKLDELLLLLKEKGYIVSVNHPFMKPWSNKMNISLGNLQTMEIMCDPTYKNSKKSTRKALKAFDQLWLKGYKIWGIGGSDSHLLPTKTYPGSKDPSIYGDPGTYVFCNGLSIENLQDSIRKGRIYFSRFRELEINIWNEGYTISVGDEAKGTIDYRIHADKPCQWRLIINGIMVDEEFGSLANFSFYLNRGSYARVEGWENDELVAFINPIHNKVVSKYAEKWYEVFGRKDDDESNYF